MMDPMMGAGAPAGVPMLPGMGAGGQMQIPPDQLMMMLMAQQDPMALAAAGRGMGGELPPMLQAILMQMSQGGPVPQGPPANDMMAQLQAMMGQGGPPMGGMPPAY